jgi:putative hydrolase of the HAD superfamily
MSLDTSRIKAVIFDYGNTLIEFSAKQVVVQNEAILKLLNAWYGPCDEEKFTSIRKRQIIAPYMTQDFIENNRRQICIELIEELYGRSPTEDRIDQILEAKYEIFLASILLPDFVIPVLKRLKQRYRLAFISNYPCTKSITESLKKLDLDDYFESIVVSGTLGVVKPHPDIFRKSLEELDLEPEECVYVGDNWLADIQGAKRIGMQAVHTTQYVSYEKFEPYEGDFNPDGKITHLEQLPDILLYTELQSKG